MNRIKFCLDDNPLLPLMHVAAKFELYIPVFIDESIIFYTLYQRELKNALIMWKDLCGGKMVIALIVATKMAKKLWTETFTIHIVQKKLFCHLYFFYGVKVVSGHE